MMVILESLKGGSLKAQSVFQGTINNSERLNIGCYS